MLSCQGAGMPGICSWWPWPPWRTCNVPDVAPTMCDVVRRNGNVRPWKCHFDDSDEWWMMTVMNHTNGVVFFCFCFCLGGSGGKKWTSKWGETCLYSGSISNFKRHMWKTGRPFVTFSNDCQRALQLQRRLSWRKLANHWTGVWNNWQ